MIEKKKLLWFIYKLKLGKELYFLFKYILFILDILINNIYRIGGGGGEVEYNLCYKI